MSDMNNLLRFLALFGGNSAKENLNNIDNSAGIGNGDGTVIKAEFNRAVSSQWAIIENNGWNGEYSKSNKNDLIDKWWASLDIDNSNRKISGTNLTEVNALSGKELDRLNSLSEGFDWNASRAETDYDTTTIEDNDGGVDGSDNDDNDYDKKGNYTKYINEATNHYKKVATLKTLLGENLYNLATKDSKYLMSVIAVTVSANIESCVAEDAVDYQAMDKVIVEALAEKIFTRQDIVSNMNTSDLKEVYELRMKYVNEEDINSIDEVRNIAADYLTALVANYEGDELSSILNNIFGEQSALEAIKGMGTEEIKSKIAELMTAVEGLEKPEKITYTLGGFEQSYNVKSGQYLTINPTITDNKGNSPANVEYKLTCNKSAHIEGLDFQATAEGVYELTLTAIVDGKEVAVSTITVNVEEIHYDLELHNSNVNLKVGSTEYVGMTIKDDEGNAVTNGVKYSFIVDGGDSSDIGVSVVDGEFRITGNKAGTYTIKFTATINGVQVGPKSIKVVVANKYTNDESYNVLKNSIENIKDNNLGSISNIDKNMHTEFGINSKGIIVFQETTTEKIYAQLLMELRTKMDGDALSILGITVENLLRTAWIMTYNDFGSSQRNDTYQFLNKVLDNIDKILAKVKDNPEYAELVNQHTAYANKDLTNNLLNYDETVVNYKKGFSSNSVYANSMTDLLRKLKNAYPYIDAATIESVFEKAKAMAETICRDEHHDCPYGTDNRGNDRVYDDDNNRDWGGKDTRDGDGWKICMTEIIQLTLYCFDKLIYKELFN